MSCEPPRRLEIGSRSVMPSPSPIRGSPACQHWGGDVRGGRRVVQNGVAVDRHHVLAVVPQTRAVVPYLESDAQRSGLEALAVSGRDLGELRGLAVDVELLDVRTGPDRQPVAVARVDPRQRLVQSNRSDKTPCLSFMPLSRVPVVWIGASSLDPRHPQGRRWHPSRWPVGVYHRVRHKRTARRARPPASRRRDPQP